MTSAAKMMRMFAQLHFVSQEARNILRKISEGDSIETYLNDDKCRLWEIMGFLHKFRNDWMMDARSMRS